MSVKRKAEDDVVQESGEKKLKPDSAPRRKDGPFDSMLFEATDLPTDVFPIITGYAAFECDLQFWKRTFHVFCNTTRVESPTGRPLLYGDLLVREETKKQCRVLARGAFLEDRMREPTSPTMNLLDVILRGLYSPAPGFKCRLVLGWRSPRYIIEHSHRTENTRVDFIETVQPGSSFEAEMNDAKEKFKRHDPDSDEDRRDDISGTVHFDYSEIVIDGKRVTGEWWPNASLYQEGRLHWQYWSASLAIHGEGVLVRRKGEGPRVLYKGTFDSNGKFIHGLRLEENDDEHEGCISAAHGDYEGNKPRYLTALYSYQYCDKLDMWTAEREGTLSDDDVSSKDKCPTCGLSSRDVAKFAYDPVHANEIFERCPEPFS